jgi:hypothetical protein
LGTRAASEARQASPHDSMGVGSAAIARVNTSKQREISTVALWASRSSPAPALRGIGER